MVEDLLIYKREKITVSTTPTGFSDNCLIDKRGNLAVKVEFTVEGNELRYCIDDDPTATEGTLVKAGERVVIEGIDNVRGFRAIAFVGRPAIIQPQFYRSL
jgi:hypothetical protein